MPIYDYHCDGCGADFERLVRGDTLVTCPKCAGERVERKLSLPARRTAGGGDSGPDLSRLGPPPGGCCGGGCGHAH